MEPMEQGAGAEEAGLGGKLSEADSRRRNVGAKQGRERTGAEQGRERIRADEGRERS